MQIINLSHERKLIYVGANLYPLKGVLITPIKDDYSLDLDASSSDILYRTCPIVGEDWRVVDDRWQVFGGKSGFADHIIDPSRGPVCVNHPTLTEALDYATGHGITSTLDMLEYAESMGLEFTNEGLKLQMQLFVEKDYKTDHYKIGNRWEVEDDYETYGASEHYYVPTYIFDPEAKRSHNERGKWVFCLEDLLFNLKRAVGAYSDFFHVKGLCVDVTFDEDFPAEVEAKIRPLIAKVNDYLRFIDDINQYEN